MPSALVVNNILRVKNVGKTKVKKQNKSNTPQPLYNTIAGIKTKNHVESKQKSIDYIEKWP